MFDQKWIKALAMALSLPSTILAMAVVCKVLVDRKILTWGYSGGIFVVVVSSTIFMMVYYAYKNKK